MPDTLKIGNHVIKPGERKRISLDVAKLYDFTDMNIPIEVIRGKKDGPVLFLSGALHGDEINGVEIIRQVLAKKAMAKLKGTLIAVPIVNVFGFNTKSRYLPDRRDLNRCFPGSENGSLTAQLAHIFMTEIVEKCTHGIDLHCAAINRINLPQIRACFENNEQTLKMAEAFDVPVVMHSDLLDGSLRKTTQELGIPTLLFEGGEALRFNGKVIKCGVMGVLSVMREIGMLPKLKNPKTRKKVFIARSSHWLRAPHSGILSIKKRIGDRVKKDQLLGVISDPFGADRHEIRARRTGIIVGATTIPLLNKGDAVFHVATFEDASLVEEEVGLFEENLSTGDGPRFIDE